MNFDELQPGPETDRLVAETIGDIFRLFAPSTNLNHAFWAAEQINLFWGMAIGQWGPTKDNLRWIVEETDDDYHPKEYASADTPAMAISLAILKFKKSKT